MKPFIGVQLVVADPNETDNLAATMPERAKKMDAQLMAYLKDLEAVIPQPIEPGSKKEK